MNYVSARTSWGHTCAAVDMQRALERRFRAWSPFPFPFPPPLPPRARALDLRVPSPSPHRPARSAAHAALMQAVLMAVIAAL